MHSISTTDLLFYVRYMIFFFFNDKKRVGGTYWSGFHIYDYSIILVGFGKDMISYNCYLNLTRILMNNTKNYSVV